MWRKIKYFFDIIIPRFCDERIAIHRVGSTITTVCAEKDVTRDTVFNGVVRRTCFNIFGVGFFMKYYEVDE